MKKYFEPKIDLIVLETMEVLAASNPWSEDNLLGNETPLIPFN